MKKTRLIIMAFFCLGCSLSEPPKPAEPVLSEPIIVQEGTSDAEVEMGSMGSEPSEPIPEKDDLSDWGPFR